MKLSTDRILTTHVGSLPRPPDLLAMLEARESGHGFDETGFEARLPAAGRPCSTGPVAYRDRHPLDTDLKNLADACAAVKPGEAFMNAASPGVLTKFVPDTYYKNEDAYVEALADALQTEYEAI